MVIKLWMHDQCDSLAEKQKNISSEMFITTMKAFLQAHVIHQIKHQEPRTHKDNKNSLGETKSGKLDKSGG